VGPNTASWAKVRLEVAPTTRRSEIFLRAMTETTEPTIVPMPAEKPERSGKGELEKLVKGVVDDYTMGTLEEDDLLTPHRIAKHIQNREEISRPSVGAITNCLKRWKKVGFIYTLGKPFAFDCYTDAAHTSGLRALKDDHRAMLKAERAEAKAADKS